MTEGRLAQIIVELARALLRDEDTDQLLGDVCAHCVELLDAAGAAVSLLDGDRDEPYVRNSVATDERAAGLARAQLHHGQGPAIEVWRTGEALAVEDLGSAAQWPTFAEEARLQGVNAVQCRPLRHRDTWLGVLQIFFTAAPPPDRSTAETATVLSDFATILLLNARRLEESSRLTEQLQTALDTRVVIEQAKGMLAGQLGMPVADAFELLRGHARDRSERLHDVALAVVQRRLRIQPGDATPT